MNIAGIIGDSIVDGPGLRTTVFFQGCAHKCEGCHNPETHSFGTANEMSVERIIEKIKKNPLCRGVTLSGGDPVFQAKEAKELCKVLKKQGYEVALYTGFTWEELLTEKNADRLELLRNVDILIDGRFEIAKRTLELKFRGSSNQRIIESKKSMAQFDENGTIKPILCTQKRWIG